VADTVRRAASAARQVLFSCRIQRQMLGYTWALIAIKAVCPTAHRSMVSPISALQLFNSPPPAESPAPARPPWRFRKPVSHPVLQALLHCPCCRRRPTEIQPWSRKRPMRANTRFEQPLEQAALAVSETAQLRPSSASARSRRAACRPCIGSTVDQQYLDRSRRLEMLLVKAFQPRKSRSSRNAPGIGSPPTSSNALLIDWRRVIGNKHQAS